MRHYTDLCLPQDPCRNWGLQIRIIQAVVSLVGLGVNRRNSPSRLIYGASVSVSSSVAKLADQGSIYRGSESSTMRHRHGWLSFII